MNAENQAGIAGFFSVLFYPWCGRDLFPSSVYNKCDITADGIGRQFSRCSAKEMYTEGRRSVRRGAHR